LPPRGPEGAGAGGEPATSERVSSEVRGRARDGDFSRAGSSAGADKTVSPAAGAVVPGVGAEEAEAGAGEIAAGAAEPAKQKYQYQ
jgi:hypothetical protein